MFENVICQDEVVSRLRKDLEEGKLPASILFSGPEYSGKLTTALELARALGCEEGRAEWNCGCRSCESHRLLLHPHTLLTGGRYFSREIEACSNAFLRTGTLSARFLFIRSVRKLTRRFDPVLWEGDEAKLSKVGTALTSVEEILRELSPGTDLPVPAKLQKTVEDVIASVRKIEDGIGLDAIPISLIRRISAWAHLGTGGAKKVVILENADRMLDSARNALLKLLEEPPKSVHLILLSTRRGAIIPTVLSRVRTYALKDRDTDASRDVLQRIFRENSPEYSSLKDYFLVFQGVKPSALRSAAVQFLQSALSPGGYTPSGGEDLSLFSDKNRFRLFLRELLCVFQDLLRQKDSGGLSGVTLQKIETWTRMVREAGDSLMILNINPGILAERLHTQMGRD